LSVLPPVAIGHCFSEEEVWEVISKLSADKALGPGSFIGLFYQTAWLVIKADIMNAFHAFWSLDFQSFFLVNQAYITLLQKKKDLVCVKDFRPISLIHNFRKLLTKVLSNRISPLMNTLVQ
jgi:hypothetical protein